jgi:FAD binding domain/Berberine and berberine like
MEDLRVATTTGTDTVLEEVAVEEFKAGLRGEVLRPSEEGYEEARTVWNAMIDKRPALIARCAGAADVIHSINFARTNKFLVAVRGGGHDVAGTAVCDGGLVVDLSRMKGIRVDPTRRTVRAEPGLTWGEFDQETQAFRLATTGGFVPTTGIAGLTLGGGLGYLMRRFGLACDNLLSVDIVTAEGQLLTASETENEDLFWAVRGGGGNFGIVTSFEYEVHPVGPMVLGGLILHPLARAKEIAQFYREFTSTSPDELTTHLAFVTSPDGQPVVAFVICYSGPVDEGEEVIRPLREFGSPVADMAGPMPYTAIQALGGDLYPHGRWNYWKSNFLQELSDEAIDTMIEQFSAAPSPFCVAAFEHLGGEVSRVGEDETAFGDRSAPYTLIITSGWVDPAETERNVEWARGFWEAMQPFTRDTVYVNYMDIRDEADRIKAAYGAETYERLVALKNKYDPTNLFRLNKNIQPTV